MGLDPLLLSATNMESGYRLPTELDTDSATFGAANMEPGYSRPIDPPGTRPMSCLRFSWACSWRSMGRPQTGFYKPMQELSQEYAIFVALKKRFFSGGRFLVRSFIYG